MSGLYGLPDSTEFCAVDWEMPDGPSGTAVYPVGESPDEPPILVLSDQMIGHGTDYSVAHLVRRLLDLEHRAVVDGYDGVAQRLAEAEAGLPLILAGLACAVRSDPAAVTGLRKAAREYLNSPALRARDSEPDS